MLVLFGAADYDDFDTSPYGTEAATYWTAYDVWEQEQVGLAMLRMSDACTKLCACTVHR